MEAFSASWILKKVTDVVLHIGRERMSLLIGLEDEIKKLRQELPLIQAVLNDAEEKQVSRRDVLIWLQHLKDFAYDVEDIFDEFETEVSTNPQMKCPDVDIDTKTDKTLRGMIGNQRVKSLKRCKNILGNCFCSGSSSATNEKPRPIIARLNIADRIKELMKTFDELLEFKKKLDLIATINPISPQESQQTSKRPQTTSTNDAQFQLLGRDKEKTLLIDKLLGTNKEDPSSIMLSVSVISIVGMGGVGKSTLAKAIYNDPKVINHFNHRKWVSVGESFDPSILIRELLNEDPNQNHIERNLEVLHEKLKSSCLKWPKFLIILDDVWNTDASKWEEVWIPLSHGIQGSKVLITCRGQKVVEATLHIPTVFLKGLDDENCFSLLMRHAFPDRDFELPSNLVKVGKEIVRHLDGLPLAAKVVGGALFNKLDEMAWEKFLKDEPWANTAKEGSVIGSLKWSYNLLPTHLKQCFGYCSLLCKDQWFNKTDLILMWMATGLIQPEGHRELEDIGDEYFMNLVKLSFFEPISDFDGPFMMHDLIHDLAEFVSSYESRNLCDDKFKASKDNEHVRHLYLGNSTDIKVLQNWKKVRTVALPAIQLPKLVNDFWLNLKYVRVLDISGHYAANLNEIGKLPVSSLIHLRYFRLPSPKLLPETLCNLHNLQSLLVAGDIYLKDVSKLVNLRHLEGTFVVGKRSGYKIEELGGLQELRNYLGIGFLENVKDKEEAIKSRMRDKKYLKHLILCWNDVGSELKQEMHSEYEQVLEGLEPHKNLQELSIVNYRGLQFPKWITDATVLCNLFALQLCHCSAMKSVPALGQLPCLKNLQLDSMDEVSIIGEELYGFQKKISLPFAALESLNITDMKNLKEWVAEGWHFPSLRSIYIGNCRNLIELPPIFSSALKAVHLNQMNFHNISGLCNLVNLEILDIEHCPVVSKALLELRHEPKLPVPFWPQLRKLWINDMQLLDGILGNANVFCSASVLEMVTVRRSDDMADDFWGENGEDDENGMQWEQFTSLKTLQFLSCHNQIYLPPQLHRLPSLKTLTISYCNKIKALPKGGIPKSLEFLTIQNHPSSPLKERCEEATGPDWLKISHVPHLNLYYDELGARYD